jgi:hypothetical protein
MSEIKNVVVITDCEPDDYFAVFLLMQQKLESMKFIVSCWTDPIKKAKIFKGIVSKYGNYPVYYGEPTKKEYNMNELEQFETTEPVMKYTSDVFDGVDTVFSLTPPVDMMALHQQNPTIFNGKKCYMYGSFNIRHLVEKEYFKFNEIYEMLKSFSSVN